jgi:hypothetical protein
MLSGGARKDHGATILTSTVLLLSIIGQVQTLTAAQARAQGGENATVCGTVTNDEETEQFRPAVVGRASPSPVCACRSAEG